MDVATSMLGRQFQITKFFILVCTLVFLCTSYEHGALDWMALDDRVAWSWGALQVVPGMLQPIRYLSANFVHFGLVHLLLNMIMLWQFGTVLEERVGGARLAVLFLLSGVVGFFASDLYYGLTKTMTTTGGASAGIAGLIGGFIGFAYAQGNPAWKRALVTIVLYAVLFAAAVPGRINHMAHLGGLIMGGLLGIAYFRQRGRSEWHRRYMLAAWVLVVVAIGSIVLARVTA